MNQIELFDQTQTLTPTTIPNFNFKKFQEGLMSYYMDGSPVMEPEIPRYAYLILRPIPQPVTKAQLKNEQIYLVLIPDTQYIVIGRLWITPEALFLIPKNKDYLPYGFSYSDLQKLKFYKVLAYYMLFA